MKNFQTVKFRPFPHIIFSPFEESPQNKFLGIAFELIKSLKKEILKLFILSFQSLKRNSID